MSSNTVSLRTEVLEAVGAAAGPRRIEEDSNTVYMTYEGTILDKGKGICSARYGDNPERQTSNVSGRPGPGRRQFLWISPTN